MTRRRLSFASDGAPSVLLAALVLSFGIAASDNVPAADPVPADAKPEIGTHELTVITDHAGHVLDVTEYVYVGVDGPELTTEKTGAAKQLVALWVGHAGLPLARADISNLPEAVVSEADLLHQAQHNLSGFGSLLPRLPSVYDQTGPLVTVAEYQFAFRQLHDAYTAAGLDDVEAQVLDLDQGGLSNVLLDVLHSGLTPPDYVEFWENFDQKPFLAEIETAEGDFHALLDALMLNEQAFCQLLAERQLNIASFLEGLAQKKLAPADLLDEAVMSAANPGAFIDKVIADGDASAVVVQVPLSPKTETASPRYEGNQEQASPRSQYLAWTVLGEMGKVRYPIDLIARIQGQGLNPHEKPVLAMDGGLRPDGGLLDPDHSGRKESWSYDVRVHLLSPSGAQPLSTVELDLDTTACAQYRNVTPDHGQFAREWRLRLGIRQGDAGIMLHPSEQANRGGYQGGRDTGNPADLLRISLERVNLDIAPKRESSSKHAFWGGSLRHGVDLIVTGDGWVYLFNVVPEQSDGRRGQGNLASLASTRGEYLCNACPGAPPVGSDDGQNDSKAIAGTRADPLEPPQGDGPVRPKMSPRGRVPSAENAKSPVPDSEAEVDASPTQHRFVPGLLLEHDPNQEKSHELAAAYYKGRQFYFMYLTKNHPLSKQLVAYPAKIDEQGRVSGTADPIEVANLNDWYGDRPRNLTATVARGCLYLAWTFPGDDGTAAWVKWSCDDGTQWFPKAGPQRVSTIPGHVRSAALSSYREGNARDALEWLVLLYTTDSDPAHIGVLANSGAGWVGGHKYRRPWGHGEWHSLAALNVKGSEGDEAILVAATTSGDGAGANQYLLRMQTFDGTWHTRGCYVPLDWTRHDRPLALAPGTLSAPSKQDQRMVQLFGINSGTYYDLRHYEFPLLGKHAEQGCLFGPVDSGFPAWSKKEPWQIAAVTGFRATPEGVRQYVSVAASAIYYRKPCRTGTTIFTATYPSDRYVIEDGTVPVDTGPGDYKLRSAWTLLGVIEGVPPFTRNGVAGDRPQSRVLYGESRSRQMTFQTDYSFDMTLGFGVSGGVEDVYGSDVSTELKYGINQKISTTQEFTTNYYHEFTNIEANSDGRYGYLLFAQPRLKNFRYGWWSADHRQRFGTVNQLFVDKVAIRSERYLLSGDPLYTGLPKRWPTSEPRTWASRLKPYEGIPTRNPERIILEIDLDPSAYGESGGGGFQRAQSHTSAFSERFSVELKKEIKAALNFSVSRKDSVDVTTTVQTTETQRGEVSVSPLPKPAPAHQDPIGKIFMTGYWIEADRERDEKPYWVPDQFEFQRPWLFTYRVSKVEDFDPKRFSAQGE